MWGTCVRSVVRIALLAALLVTVTIRGRVIVSDDFNYPDGPLVEVSAGKWKTHSGTAGQISVVDGQVMLSQKRSEDVNAPFPGGVLGPLDTLELYAGFRINFS